ncbi:SWIM zinc finger family protein [Phytoactinopolyspora endophytica]|uniref:SWIM zinc finger family protein n=1 Tax=Phytoactinopolyspora endophytica TaxID=1642495 RepID=UPI00101CDD2C|nr:SWIM zinc finger family protein [Phytoactinopolyspora endophytica]
MSELAKGFPAFEARKRRTRRAQTWWGNAWIDALEDSSLDSDALRRGRAYAHGGHVGTITISPGRISATVYGDDHTPHETLVFLDEFNDSDWERLLGRIASKAGHVAALLERDMPDDLADAAYDAGVQLLPGIDDLEPRCSCDDWGHPCTHAAALCYQASWLLDADPFLLLLMRGRGEDDLLDELQRRNSGPPANMRDAAGREGGAIESSDGTPEDSEADSSAPLDPATVDQIISDAAARARELLTQASHRG